MKKRFFAIILAAGLSKRFGSQKLVQRVGQATIVELALRPFLVSQCVDEILIVVGHESEKVARVLKPYPVVIINNPNYYEGISSSIRIGISYIGDEDETFIHLADKPLVRPDLIKYMKKVSSKKTPHIVIPVYEGKRGHPILIGPGWYLKRISDVRGDVGLRYVIERERENVVYISADEGVLTDIDTPEDLGKIEKMEVKLEKG
ncbi:MAG: nucleotidyltransferase family protein [Desulfobacterota bacterium]|nr:nucleotidyltransferase family protein [Thermodesulfobacteriota bacterium]MDW8002283.1 nucleotidyltransferase family protein [Deltaproteobacteria bacterium]